MKIFELIGIALLGASFSLVIKSVRPELASIVAVSTGILLLLYTIAELTGIVDTVRLIAERNGIEAGYVGTLLKILGIAYAAEFGTRVCRDAGESAIAARVELSGRILILAAALPTVVTSIDRALKLLGELAP